MSKRYTAEFKRDAVALVRSSGQTVTEVARELGVSAEGLRDWVKQAKTDRGRGAAGRADHGGEGRAAAAAAGRTGNSSRRSRS